MLLNVGANLTVNGKSLEVYALGMSPSGKAKGPLVHIPDLGCEKVTDTIISALVQADLYSD